MSTAVMRAGKGQNGSVTRPALERSGRKGSQMPQQSLLRQRLWSSLQSLPLIATISKYIFIYNVTFGLYMLDWWERYLFNTLVFFLLFTISLKVVRVVFRQYSWLLEAYEVGRLAWEHRHAMNGAG